MSGNVKDKTGNIYGFLQVLELDREKTLKTKRTYWKCKCLYCGEINSYRTDALNRIQSCKKCARREKLIGKRFGKLIVESLNIEESNKYGRSVWNCKCDCGETRQVLTSFLINGSVKECKNCTRKKNSESQRLDLTNQRFGKLVALELDENSIGKGLKWFCRCDCGNIVKVTANHLRTGHTSSCGCLISKGERLIEESLKELNYKYKKQYSFSDLKGDTGYVLRFDFGILDEENNLVGLIEFQGQQHYEKTGFPDADKNFEKTQRYDNLKRKYCKEKSIVLIEINYKNLEEINSSYIKKLLQKNGICL